MVGANEQPDHLKDVLADVQDDLIDLVGFLKRKPRSLQAWASYLERRIKELEVILSGNDTIIGSGAPDVCAIIARDGFHYSWFLDQLEYNRGAEISLILTRCADQIVALTGDQNSLTIALRMIADEAERSIL